MLIPFKIILKALGYILSAILRFIGLGFVHIAIWCGWVPSLIGGFILFADVAYMIMVITNYNGAAEMKLCWVYVAVGFILGTIIASLSLWLEALGDKLEDWGEDLSDTMSGIDILP